MAVSRHLFLYIVRCFWLRSKCVNVTRIVKCSCVFSKPVCNKDIPLTFVQNDMLAFCTQNLCTFQCYVLLLHIHLENMSSSAESKAT